MNSTPLTVDEEIACLQYFRGGNPQMKPPVGWRRFVAMRPELGRVQDQSAQGTPATPLVQTARPAPVPTPTQAITGLAGAGVVMTAEALMVLANQLTGRRDTPHDDYYSPTQRQGRDRNYWKGPPPLAGKNHGSSKPYERKEKKNRPGKKERQKEKERKAANSGPDPESTSPNGGRAPHHRKDAHQTNKKPLIPREDKQGQSSKRERMIVTVSESEDVEMTDANDEAPAMVCPVQVTDSIPMSVLPFQPPRPSVPRPDPIANSPIAIQLMADVGKDIDQPGTHIAAGSGIGASGTAKGKEKAPANPPTQPQVEEELIDYEDEPEPRPSESGVER